VQIGVVVTRGLLLLALTGLTACGREAGGGAAAGTPSPAPSVVALPSPNLEGAMSLEEALAERRSTRSFDSAPVTLEDAAQLLWAAQGITDARYGYRAAPSAGALYPLEVYLLADRVSGLRQGVYHYLPGRHALQLVRDTVDLNALAKAALSQSFVSAAPAVIAIATVFDRTTGKYGERGRRYVYLEAGHAAQNVYLQATALELGTVAVGAFDDEAVRHVVGMGADEQPIYLMPFGTLPGR
jgi:SagB-type dehydrogenase family enzyme